jgi:autotransporter-associated beta strand protein
MSRRLSRRSALVTAVSTTIVSSLLGTSASASVPSGLSGNYKLVFGDEFNTSYLDPMKWGYNYPWGANEHVSEAYMSSSQVLMTGTALNLQAVAVRNPNATNFNDPNFGYMNVNYTSGCINTSGLFNFTYGYVEASIQVPSVQGTWPAFWMLQGGWPPEVDIVEHLQGASGATSNNQDIVTYHYTNPSGAASSYGSTATAGSDLSSGFHTYGFAWTPTSMTYYLDGSAIYTTTDTTAISQASNMYMILENQVGGWAGTPAANSAFPANMLVDYVHVYQINPSTSATTTFATNGVSGSIDTASNWTVEAPKYQDQTVVFGPNIYSTVALSWTNYRMIGGLQFGSSTAYTLGSSAGGFSLSVSSGNAAILVTSTNTATQTINAKLDLYSSANITNNSAAQLVLNGVISGPGGITFEGTGTTVIANNNIYTGNTYIDNGTQAPATVLVTRSNPFGTTGTVIFNLAGNYTQGLIQIENSRTIPNNIQLSARQPSNTQLVSLENLSGTNIFSGTVTLYSGGNQYVIQSDQDLMEFTGTTGGSISFSGGSSGTRIFTLQGNGNGLISGSIVNGYATVGLIKAGAGTWTLAGSNAFGGSVAVNAGTLQLANPYAIGYTPYNSTFTTTGITVASGATLDLFGQSTNSPVTVTGTGTAGNGAIYNSSSTAASILGDVSATGNFSIGGIGNITLNHVSGTSPDTLTKVGTDTVTLSGSLLFSGQTSVDNTNLSLTVNSGDVILAKTVSGSRAVNGLVTINTGGMVQLGGTTGDQIYNGTTSGVVLAGGTFDLAGQSEAISGLTGTSGLITNSSTTASTLTFGADNTGAGISGTLGASILSARGAVNLVKIGSGTQTLTGSLSYANTTVSAGRLTLQTPLIGTAQSLTVAAGAAVTLAAPPNPTSATVAANLASISIAANGSVVISPVNRATTKQELLITTALSLTNNTGLLDLGNGDMVIHGASLPTVQAMVASWYRNGLRGGQGLGSSVAGTGSGADQYTSLAVIANTNGIGGPLFTTFDGVAVATSDILVKYTYLGDTNLDGTVDASDLANALAGQAGGLTGWVNGDFNYDGQVTGADISLLLNSLANQTVTFGDGGGNTGAVPEPGTLALAIAALPIALRRRR